MAKHKEILETNQVPINEGGWIIKLLYTLIIKHTTLKKCSLYVPIQKGVLDILMIIGKSKLQNNYRMNISLKIYACTYTI